MKIYLVGGAVRDKLLGRAVMERDWVVVGATPADLQRLGYRQVGRDFPVFLHPTTGEEYALARRERKTAPGYTGFDFDTSPTVTLEEDLSRRDLTINAMAEAPDGSIIDPFKGQADLKARLLRHVSMAFTEDPVRILRAARFAARFAGLGFKVAAETIELMRAMAASGEVDALVSERVWKECVRALCEPHPEVFFEVLAVAESLLRLFPASLQRGLPALQKAVALGGQAVVRFAALLHCLSLTELNAMCQRFRVPNEYYELARLVVQYLPAYDAVFCAGAAEIVRLLQAVDAFRRSHRFHEWLLACEASSARVHAERLRDCLAVAQAIDVAPLVKGASGADIAKRIFVARTEKIQIFLQKKDAP